MNVDHILHERVYNHSLLGFSMQALILASESIYKRDLLKRLRIPFEVEAAYLDEQPLIGESVKNTTLRLALDKAKKIAEKQVGCWVLGCDQAADLDGVALSKPESLAGAVSQLRRLSGKRITFYTSVVLYHLSTSRGLETSYVYQDETHVSYRVLSNEEIDRYLAQEPAFDVAGAAKSEGFGITLFDRIESIDPTALIGLPLIGTCQLLRQAGFLL